MVDCPVAQSPADFRDTITKLFGDEPIEDEDFDVEPHGHDTLTPPPKPGPSCFGC